MAIRQRRGDICVIHSPLDPSPELGTGEINHHEGSLKKRDLVRKPSMRSELKPGQILRLTDALEIKITRSLSARLTAEELDRESRPLAATEGPAVDSAALGEELRG